MRKIIINFMAIIIAINLTGCSSNGVPITDGSSVANGALGGVAIFKVLAVAQVAKNYYETGDGSQGAIDHAENSKEYTEKKKKSGRKKLLYMKKS